MKAQLEQPLMNSHFIWTYRKIDVLKFDTGQAPHGKMCIGRCFWICAVPALFKRSYMFKNIFFNKKNYKRIFN